MTHVEFDLATIAQELRILSRARHVNREAWVYSVTPCIVRAMTLAFVLAETYSGETREALLGLAEALGKLAAPPDPQTDTSRWGDPLWAACLASHRRVGSVLSERVQERWVLDGPTLE